MVAVREVKDVACKRRQRSDYKGWKTLAERKQVREPVALCRWKAQSTGFQVFASAGLTLKVSYFRGQTRQPAGSALLGLHSPGLSQRLPRVVRPMVLSGT